MLEQQLRIQLFERYNKRIELTAKGRQLYADVSLGLEQIQNGIKAIQGDPNPSSLRVSSTRSFATRWLLPNIQAFQKYHPEIQVQLVPNNDLVTFTDDSVDIAVRMGRNGYPGLQTERLADEYFYLVSSPSLFNPTERFQPERIFSVPFLLDTSPSFQQALDKALASYGLTTSKLDILVQSEDINPIIDSAIAGLGVALVTSTIAEQALQNGHLVRLLDFKEKSPFNLMLAAPERHFSWPKVTLFADWIKRTLASEGGKPSQ